MKAYHFIIFVVCLSFFNACGQTSENNKTYSNSNQETPMDLSRINNPTVKSAVEALQSNDIKAWYAHFTENAIFTDDG